MKRAALLLLGLVACSAAPPPPAPTPHELPPPPAPPPPAPARWTEPGATFVGPEIDGGTLVVVGGRRALVAKDGTVKTETVPSAEPIQEIIEVPTSAGMKLVARTQRSLVRLDDPLGAPAPILQTKSEIRQIGSMPNTVAVWTADGELPRYFDLATGAAATPKLPPLPVRSIAFIDAQHGAAVLEVAGTVVTSDGGATWRPALDSSRGDAVRMSGVHVRRGSLRAFVASEGPDAPIDPTSAKIGAVEERTIASNEAPLVKWARVTRQDPLALAASYGVELPNGNALVASNGLVARVELKTGLPIEIVEFAKGEWLSSCTVAHAGDSAWVACGLSSDAAPDYFDPWGVFRVDIAGAKLAVDKPAVIRNGDAELHASPSGGLVFLNSCKPEDDGQACARQPDGSWVSIHTDVDLADRGTGALGDGRIVYLASNNGEDEDPAHPENTAEDAKTHAERIVALDAKGNAKTLLKLPIPQADDPSDVVAQGPIQEDADRTLHVAVIVNGTGYVFAGKPGAEPRVEKIESTHAIALNGMHAAAITDDQLVTSTDAGMTWTPAPQAAKLGFLEGSRWFAGNDPSFTVSEVGLHLNGANRIGWGAEEALVDRPKVAGPLVPPSTHPPQAGPENMLTCKSEGGGQGTPPFIGPVQVKAALGSKPPPKGTRRETSTFSFGRAGMLDTSAILEEEGKEEKDALPTKWTIKWFDGRGVGERIRQVSFAAPPNTGRNSSLRFATSDGARAMFSIHSGKRSLLVRVKGNNQTEIQDIAFELTPQSDPPVFGTEKGEPIAWFHEGTLVVWIAGEAPRGIATVAPHAQRLLGQPTKDGVPLLVAGNDWSLSRVFTIPPIEKGASPPPPSVALAGWTDAPNLRRAAGSLEACTTATAKGQRFLLTRNGSVHALVDGGNESGSTSVFDVRVIGTNACVAVESELLSPSGPPRASSNRGELGMIGMLGGGRDLEGMLGTEVDDSFGMGGLGLAGFGPGGGGRGEGIGLGSIGTIGHGSGSGTGQGFGSGQGRLAVVQGGKQKTPPPPSAKPKPKPKENKGPVSYLRVDLVGKHAEGGDRGTPPEGTVRRMTCTRGALPAVKAQ